MRIKPRIAINLVGVGVLFVVTVGWVLIRLVAPGVIDRPFEVTADFASSGGVFTNQEVAYRGVVIGKVGELALNEDGVSIELLIQPDWENEIPSNVTAKVQSKSAVGEQFVNLIPSEVSTPATLADGDEIPRSRTELPVDFQRLLRTLDNVLTDVPPGKTRRLIQSLSAGVGGRADEIAVILESLGTLSDTFASVAPEQQRLLDNATKTGTTFLRTKDEFTDAIKAADQVLEGLGDEPQELRRLFVQNDRLAREGLRLIARNGDELKRGLDALADFIDYQLATRDVIDDSLTYVPAFLHAVEDASVPWRDPDGDEYYRIRAGLIVDNVESSWPCKYDLPHDYHRYPHEREFREPATFPELECKGGSTAAAASASSDDSFFDALRILVSEELARDDHAEEIDAGGEIDFGDVFEDRREEPEAEDPSPEPSAEQSPAPSATASPSP